MLGESPHICENDMISGKKGSSLCTLLFDHFQDVEAQQAADNREARHYGENDPVTGTPGTLSRIPP